VRRGGGRGWVARTATRPAGPARPRCNRQRWPGWCPGSQAPPARARPKRSPTEPPATLQVRGDGSTRTPDRASACPVEDPLAGHGFPQARTSANGKAGVAARSARGSRKSSLARLAASSAAERRERSVRGPCFSARAGWRQTPIGLIACPASPAIRVFVAAGQRDALSAESAHAVRWAYTAELEVAGASQTPRCRKHQSSHHAAGGSAAGIGHRQSRRRRQRESRASTKAGIGPLFMSDLLVANCAPVDAHSACKIAANDLA
jgi:hypothetical protein